ncbi:MAG: hypothetical protein ATN31_02135 [Candidatus Epulonipiscioides saccharophilum]|nr:MAG: hypothetical protein ATN31_02135 [Epulopiscium sp. AS2M-Bin001]
MKKFKWIILALFIMGGSSLYASELPPNILENARCFELIDDITADYTNKFSSFNPAGYITKVNGEKNLQRLTFFSPTEPLVVNGQSDIDLPADVATIMRFFTNFYYTGDFENGNAMKLYIVSPDGKEHILNNNGNSWGSAGKKASHGPISATGHLPIGAPTSQIDYSGYKLRFKGTGTIAQVYLWNPSGIATEYDTSAYGVLGADLPIEEIKIKIDTTANLILDGYGEFEPGAYKNLHATPLSLFSNTTTITSSDEISSKAYEDWGFEAARGTYRFQSFEDSKLITAGENGYTKIEDELYELYQPNLKLQQKFENLYPTIGNDYVATFDGWPSWQWEQGITVDKLSASPAYEHFDAAADIAGHIVKAFNTKFGDYAPKYFEVKNESTITNEWHFFNTESKEVAWNYLTEFHNKMADAIHELNPNTLVGGPSSAFMYLEKNNFNEAKYQLDFMDATKNSLDWYSHHFYENSNLMVNGRKDNSDGFLAGRFEAVMDLLIGHMENTDNVKPFLITEAGNYNSLHTDIDYFQKLTAYNGYMLRFMDYPEVVEMYVPYLYALAGWTPDSNINLYQFVNSKAQNQGIKDQMTYAEAYVDIWKDFDGKYILSEVVANDELLEERVFTKAVRDGDTIYLAVHNLNPARVELDLDFGAKVISASKKYSYLEYADLNYKNEVVEDLDNIYMRAQEMAMFEIKLEEGTAFDGTLARESYYSAQELVDSGANKIFTIKVDSFDNAKKEAATLRVNFGREKQGFDGQMDVSINGTHIGTRSLEYTNKSGDIFTFMDFDLPDTSVIKYGENEITVSMPTGGVISNVKLINYYR